MVLSDVIKTEELVFYLFCCILKMCPTNAQSAAISNFVSRVYLESHYSINNYNIPAE